MALLFTVFLVFGSLALLFGLMLVKTMVTMHLVERKFKKDSKGLGMPADWRYLDGHLKSFLFKPAINHELHEYHARYGKSFGVLYGTKPMVISIDLELVKSFGLDEQADHINRTQLGIPMKELELDCILTAEDDQWRRIRRAMAPAFRNSRKSMFTSPNVSKEIEHSVDRLMGAIEEKLNEAALVRTGRQSIIFNAEDYIHRFSSDIILSCFFKQPNVIDFHSEKDKMIETLDKGLLDVFQNPLIRWSVAWPFVRPVVDLLVAWLDPLGAWNKQMIDYLRAGAELNLRAKKELRSRRHASGNQQVVNEDDFLLKDGTRFTRNMLDHLIDQLHKGKLSQREYLHSTWFLFSAADKPISDVLNYCLYQLALHSDIQDKLAESVILHGHQSEYLGWVINEALRLMPPAPIGCSRTVRRDFVVEEGIVPRGTFVMTPTYVIHRLREYWGDDADQFQPDRFARQHSFHPCQFMPFGKGSRGCPGQDLAMHEMRLMMGKLIARYRFDCEPKCDERFDAPFFIYIMPNEPTILRLSCRG